MISKTGTACPLDRITRITNRSERPFAELAVADSHICRFWATAGRADLAVLALPLPAGQRRYLKHGDLLAQHEKLGVLAR